MKQNTKFKTGTLVLLSEGEYSDYLVGPLFRCLKDLHLESLAESFYAHAPVDKFDEHRKDVGASSFALWIVSSGWVEEIEYQEVHVGSYGDFKCGGFVGRMLE